MISLSHQLEEKGGMKGGKEEKASKKERKKEKERTQYGISDCLVLKFVFQLMELLTIFQGNSTIPSNGSATLTGPWVLTFMRIWLTTLDWASIFLCIVSNANCISIMPLITSVSTAISVKT